MRRRWPLPGALAAFLAFLLVANCDQGVGPSEPAPVQPEVSADLLGGLLGGDKPSPAPSNLTLIVEEDGAQSDGLVTGLFGLLGGVLQLEGHSLLVPRGAVLRVTLLKRGGFDEARRRPGPAGECRRPGCRAAGVSSLWDRPRGR